MGIKRSIENEIEVLEKQLLVYTELVEGEGHIKDLRSSILHQKIKRVAVFLRPITALCGYIKTCFVIAAECIQFCFGVLTGFLDRLSQGLAQQPPQQTNKKAKHIHHHHKVKQKVKKLNYSTYSFDDLVKGA